LFDEAFTNYRPLSPYFWSMLSGIPIADLVNDKEPLRVRSA